MPGRIRRPASEHRLLFNLQVAAARVRVMADQEFIAHAGITAAQAGVLLVIAETPGANQRSLAVALHQRESAITSMVGRLVATGHVDRQPSQADGRAWEVRLTPAGKRALNAINDALEVINAKIESVVDPRDVAGFVSVLRRLEHVDVGDES